MADFKFEDYRQPWETGPHWELKREFIEKYSDVFPEDRLLCLAQAYSNIVLMNCCYPDQVMRQISILSKPLEMRKRFQETSNSNEKETLKNNQNKRVSEKLKSIYENSGRPFKQMKFCSSSQDAPISSSPSITNENAANPSKTTHYSTLHDQQTFQQSCDSVSSVTNIDQSPIICDSQIRGNVTQQTEEEKNILSTLGSEFIRNFIQFVRNFQAKGNSPVEAISYAAQKLKIPQQVRYDISLVPGSPAHAPVYSSKIFLNNCLISMETGLNKKKAKIKSAETAVDVLIKLSSIISNTASEAKNESLNNQTVNSVKELTHVGEMANSSMELLQDLSEKIVNRTKEQPVVISLKHIAENLNVQNYIAFEILPVSYSSVNLEYICNFFVRNILISSGKHTNIEEAKRLAVESGFTKLENISEYEIQSRKLVKKQSSSVYTSTDFSTKCSVIESQKNQHTSFILNEEMFNSSLRDGFVLIRNLKRNEEASRNLRTLLIESANFCHKSFEYKFEDVFGIEPPSKKTYVVIGEEIVGTGIASSKEESKTLACEDAYETLKQKYYTLKVKNEYIDGYIISRKQVFEGESFSSGALTESNIGCKMLKSMGWTGGGLGASGILEPVEARGHHSFGRGLGFGNDLGDVQLFKKSIESMLHDYSRTNTLSDLVFSKEFSKDERKEIHRIASKFHLHTASRGVNENRFLTVRHKYNVTQVLRYLVNHKGSNSKFELIDASEMPFGL